MTTPFPSPAWEEAFTGYELSELAKGHSTRTIKIRRSSVLMLSLRFPASRPEEITRTELRTHFRAIRADHKPGGIVSTYNDLRSFFAWLAEDAEIPNAMDSVPRPKAPIAETPVLSAAQLKALLATCSGRDQMSIRDKALILILLETGIRRTECISLRADDIDLRACTAMIREGKGGKARVVIFGPSTSDALRRWLRVRPARCGDALFSNGNGEPLGFSGIGWILKTRGEQAGIPGLRAHVFRHSWCHYMLQNGVGELNIQTLAGWTSGAQLQRYGSVLRVQRAVAAARAHPVAGMLR